MTFRSGADFGGKEARSGGGGGGEVASHKFTLI